MPPFAPDAKVVLVPVVVPLDSFRDEIQEFVNTRVEHPGPRRFRFDHGTCDFLFDRPSRFPYEHLLRDSDHYM